MCGCGGGIVCCDPLCPPGSISGVPLPACARVSPMAGALKQTQPRVCPWTLCHNPPPLGTVPFEPLPHWTLLTQPLCPLTVIQSKSPSVLAGASSKKNGFGDIGSWSHYVTTSKLTLLICKMGIGIVPIFSRLGVEESSVSKFLAQSINDKNITCCGYYFYPLLGLPRTSVFEKAGSGLIYSECLLCAWLHGVCVFLRGPKFIGAPYLMLSHLFRNAFLPFRGY